jgi:hypothetical protein
MMLAVCQKIYHSEAAAPTGILPPRRYHRTVIRGGPPLCIRHRPSVMVLDPAVGSKQLLHHHLRQRQPACHRQNTAPDGARRSDNFIAI